MPIERNIKNIALALVLSVSSSVVFAASAPSGVIQHANNDVANTASLQRGARNFVNYCMGCHSAKYVRYSRLAADLALTESQVIENLMFTGDAIHDTMQVALPQDAAARWFGVAPPDLSLIARARGTDYVYSFLKSFYLDPKRPTGVNNLVLPGTSMPHVLWELQGYQAAVYDGESDPAHDAVHKKFKGFELAQPGALTPAEYDTFVRDTVNFLDYISEPMQLERRNLGFQVLGFLLVFFLFAFLLKKEYWKDVK
jgi:ubiquinol-cytochrome c reductase cytochrome c1 subunit